jgi:DNA repair exonuclease SbcCD ATPase subunit
VTEKRKKTDKAAVVIGTCVIISIFVVFGLVWYVTSGEKGLSKAEQRRTLMEAKEYHGRLGRDRNRLLERIEKQKQKNEQLDEKLANLELEYDTLQMGFCKEESEVLSVCLDELSRVASAVKELSNLDPRLQEQRKQINLQRIV